MSASIELPARKKATGKNACPTGTNHACRWLICLQHCGANHFAGALALERFAGQPVHRRGAAPVRKFPRSPKKRQLYDREGREERNYENWAYDLLDAAVPAFHKQPFVTVV